MGIYSVAVNYWAVLISGVVSMVLGSLWYGPVFGKQWMRLMGLGKKDISKARKKGMGKLYLVNFITALVLAFVLSHFITYVNASTFIQGIGVGALVWLGFIATVSMGSVLWEGRPVRLYLINTLYWLVNLAIIGGILAVW